MKNWVRSNKGFLAFLVLFGMFRTAVADWNPIPSASMHPNLLEGDVVLVNRLAFDLKVPLTDVVLAHLGEPRRGDIVTFRSPRDRTLLIKRVVALPGDVVEMRNERLFINGRGADYHVVEQSLDSVGGTFLERSVDCLADNGHLVSVGNSSKMLAQVDISTLLDRSLS